jgi:hypothetical protein
MLPQCAQETNIKTQAANGANDENDLRDMHDTKAGPPAGTGKPVETG